MKTILVTTILAATFFALRAVAGEVAYQLETKPLGSIEEPTIAQPLTIAFEERSWATPGIEDAAGGDYTNWNTGIDICASRIGAVIRASDPIWTDQQLWPRTRALWGRGEFYRATPEPEPIFSFVLGGLQR